MKNRRVLSWGTLLMLIITLLVIGGSIYVMDRLSAGRKVNVTGLSIHTLDLSRTETAQPAFDTPNTIRETVRPEQTATQKPQPEKRMSLIVGGTLALNGEVRKNSYSSESRKYDYTDLFYLIRDEFDADLNVLFWENILSDQAKAGDVVAPAYTADLMREAGIQAAACGFARAYDQGESGITATITALQSRDTAALGLTMPGENDFLFLREYGGVRVAVMEYTSTVAASTRRNMQKKEQNGLIPEADPETIVADIARARRQGADAVIVLVHWLKAGATAGKSQKALAQQLAAAGADMIVGSGSRIPQGMEFLYVNTGEGTADRKVLCIWDPGCLMTGDRSSGIKRMSGYLARVTLRVTPDGTAMTEEVEWIPVYTWKYRQDGRYYYRTLPANGPVPDGMDGEQSKLMQRARETVRDAMKNAPESIREAEVR